MTTIKSIFILLILAIVGFGFYFFLANKNVLPQTASEAAASFYKSYQGCLLNPPREASGQVSIYCQNHTGLTTSDFVKNIEAGGIAKLGADPIGCAQNPPQNFLVSDAIPIDDKTATLIVKEFFGGPRLDIRVNLKKVDDTWKVDNVLCPRPDPASDPGITDTWATYRNDNSHISFKYPVSAGSNFPPMIKTTSTATQVSFQEIGTEFSLVIQPVRPGFPKYFEDSIFQESDQIGPVKWDISLSQNPPFVAYQITKNNMQYIFVFPNETEKNQLQQTILSTFQFLDSKGTTTTQQ